MAVIEALCSKINDGGRDAHHRGFPSRLAHQALHRAAKGPVHLQEFCSLHRSLGVCSTLLQDDGREEHWNRLDARFNKAFKELDKQEDMRFDQYVARKVRAWYKMFPPSSSGAGGNDDFEEGTGEADGEEDGDGDEEEAMALSGGE